MKNGNVTTTACTGRSYGIRPLKKTNLALLFSECCPKSGKGQQQPCPSETVDFADQLVAAGPDQNKPNNFKNLKINVDEILINFFSSFSSKK